MGTVSELLSFAEQEQRSLLGSLVLPRRLQSVAEFGKARKRSRCYRWFGVQGVDYS